MACSRYRVSLLGGLYLYVCMYARTHARMHVWMYACMLVDWACKATLAPRQFTDLLCIPIYFFPPVVPYLLRSTVVFITESHLSRLVPWNVLSDEILIQLKPYTQFYTVASTCVVCLKSWVFSLVTSYRSLFMHLPYTHIRHARLFMFLYDTSQKSGCQLYPVWWGGPLSESVLLTGLSLVLPDIWWAIET
jgi:hypothetical protein